SGVRMFLLAVRGGWVDRLGLSEVERPRALESRASAVRALNHFLEIIRRSDVGEDPEPGLRALLAGLAPTEPPRLPKQRPSWITEVAEKALDAGEASPTLSQLAEQYNIHPVYLARAFRRHYGTSIGAVRRQARIERAIALLAESTTPLADVVLEAGYADQSHLCRELKRETDWSPGRLRRHASALGRLGSG
ncbi:MAG: AraC family transcriptional regulator, partial [Acidobacteriota bacterium]